MFSLHLHNVSIFSKTGGSLRPISVLQTYAKFIADTAVTEQPITKELFGNFEGKDVYR